MNDPFLVILAVLALANLIGLVLLWIHIDRNTNSSRAQDMRITRLEERQAAAISHQEVRQIHERLANIEGSVATTKDLMKTIQEHLLEND